MKFLRWLVSFAAHLAWQRIGGRGAVPPIRLREREVHFPALFGTWQSVAALWVLGQLWKRHGHDIKTHMMIAGHPAVNKIGAWLPEGSKAN